MSRGKKKKGDGWEVFFFRFYLHAHRFLYKLDYNSKWNTQEKNPTNIKSRKKKRD